MEMLTFSSFDSLGKGIYVHTYTIVNYESQKHGHDFFEIVFVLSGEVVHEVNDGTQILTEGDVLLIRDKDMHMLKSFNSAIIVNIAFSFDIWNAVRLLMAGHVDGFYESEQPEIRPLHDRKAYFTSKVSKIFALEQNSLLWECETKSLIVELLYCMIMPVKHSLPKWIDTLTKQMEMQENFVFGIDRLFKLTGKTQEHISRQFRRYLNCSPTEYVNKLRMRYVINRLILTDDSVTDISYDAGFNNLSYFYRLFKNETSLSPQKYRQVNRMKLV